MPIVQKGNIVRTNYGTGPYLITHVSNPCTCPACMKHLDGDDSPSERHYHMTCCDPRNTADKYWLNGYRLDGTSVWSSDRVDVVGVGRNIQMELFA